MGAHLCCLRPSNSEPEKVSSSEKYATSGSNKSSFSALDGGNEGKGTLLDWLVSSPGSNRERGGGGGELHVLKHISKRVCTSSKRVHADFIFGPRDSLLMEKLVKPDAGEGNRLNASTVIDRSQNGNLKKKVSFRLPEESDIFLFYSSEEEALISDQACVPSPLLVAV